MKKCLALLLAIFMLVSTPISAVAAEPSTLDANVPSVWAEGDNDSIATASSLYIMATYYDTNFYFASLAKDVYLENPCVQITYRCTVENNATDTVRLIIVDKNGGGYDKNISLTADGASHSMALYLPAGTYGIQVGGNIILHNTFAVNFKGYV